jgi:hypothetical protein
MFHRGTSRSSSLCTFPEQALSRAWLTVTILHMKWGEGFPEFTRFFNHDFSWKLQFPFYSHPLYLLSYRGTSLARPKPGPLGIPNSEGIELPEIEFYRKSDELSNKMCGAGQKRVRPDPGAQRRQEEHPQITQMTQMVSRRGAETQRFIFPHGGHVPDMGKPSARLRGPNRNATSFRRRPESRGFQERGNEAQTDGLPRIPRSRVMFRGRRGDAEM